MKLRRRTTHGQRCRYAGTGVRNHHRRIWPFTHLRQPLPVSPTNSSTGPGPCSRNLLLSKSGRPIGRREDGAAAVPPCTSQIGRHAYTHLRSHATTTPGFPKRTAQARGLLLRRPAQTNRQTCVLGGVRADAMAALPCLGSKAVPFSFLTYRPPPAVPRVPIS